MRHVKEEEKIPILENGSGVLHKKALTCGTVELANYSVFKKNLD
jgi:hypothetical protein